MLYAKPCNRVISCVHLALSTEAHLGYLEAQQSACFLFTWMWCFITVMYIFSSSSECFGKEIVGHFPILWKLRHRKGKRPAPSHQVRKHHCWWLSCPLPPAAFLKKDLFFLTFIHLKCLEAQQAVSVWMCFAEQMSFNPMHL